MDSTIYHQILRTGTRWFIDQNAGITVVVGLNSDIVGHVVCAAIGNNALERVLQLSEA